MIVWNEVTLRDLVTARLWNWNSILSFSSYRLSSIKEAWRKNTWLGIYSNITLTHRFEMYASEPSRYIRHFFNQYVSRFFLISPGKHMLWVLIRRASWRLIVYNRATVCKRQNFLKVVVHVITKLFIWTSLLSRAISAIKFSLYNMEKGELLVIKYMNMWFMQYKRMIEITAQNWNKILETPKMVTSKQCRPRSDAANAASDQGMHWLH